MNRFYNDTNNKQNKKEKRHKQNTGKMTNDAQSL